MTHTTEELVERLCRRICEARGISADNPTGRRVERDNGEMTPVCVWEQFTKYVEPVLGSPEFAALLEQARAKERERKIDEFFKDIGWPEIHAFQEELAKSQDIHEDAGGFFIRALKALFGSKKRPVVENYQAAAERLVAAATRAKGGADGAE